MDGTVFYSSNGEEWGTMPTVLTGGSVSYQRQAQWNGKFLSETVMTRRNIDTRSLSIKPKESAIVSVGHAVISKETSLNTMNSMIPKQNRGTWQTVATKTIRDSPAPLLYPRLIQEKTKNFGLAGAPHANLGAKLTAEC